MLRTLSTIGTCLALASAVDSQVVVSEIMYNPDSNESSPNPAEWVELFNTGATTVALGGWTLGDEDGSTLLPAGTMIAPGEALVLFADTITAADFKAAWPGAYQAVPIAFSAFAGLSNSPSPTNEVLTLFDGSLAVVDAVNFDDASPWPPDTPDGPSIALLECFLDATANDDGSHWRRSIPGLRGATTNTVTSFFGGADVGSPGVAPVTTAAVAFRNGTGANPSSYVSLTPPIIGTTWTSTIDIAAAGATLSFIGISTAPTLPTVLPIGELLVDPGPGFLGLDFALGTHVIALAPDCTLAGTTLFTQGGTFRSGPVLQLENALDLTFGSH